LAEAEAKTADFSAVLDGDHGEWDRLMKASPKTQGRRAMISLEDCIAFSGLTYDEVEAIAEHEHLPDIAAATLGRYLLDHPGGASTIRRMIVDDIRAAQGTGSHEHLHHLVMALRQLLHDYPDARLGIKVG
jgi:hypothetical protein